MANRGFRHGLEEGDRVRVSAREEPRPPAELVWSFQSSYPLRPPRAGESVNESDVSARPHLVSHVPIHRRLDKGRFRCTFFDSAKRRTSTIQPMQRAPSETLLIRPPGVDLSQPANPVRASTGADQSFTNIEAVREQMIDQQVRAGDVLDERVLNAMREVDRELFAPAEYRKLAYVDAIIPIGHGQSMLPPILHGRILQALDTDPRDVALLVGAGTGYLAACLGALVARVRALELFSDLAEQARTNLFTVASNNVAVEVEDGMQLDEQGSYNVIAVTGSLPLYDERFQRALRIGGRLFVVVGGEPVMEAWRVTRIGEREWQRESLFETVIDPLIHAPRPPAFVF